MAVPLRFTTYSDLFMMFYEQIENRPRSFQVQALPVVLKLQLKKFDTMEGGTIKSDGSESRWDRTFVYCTRNESESGL